MLKPSPGHLRQSHSPKLIQKTENTQMMMLVFVPQLHQVELKSFVLRV